MQYNYPTQFYQPEYTTVYHNPIKYQQTEYCQECYLPPIQYQQNQNVNQYPFNQQQILNTVIPCTPKYQFPSQFFPEVVAPPPQQISRFEYQPQRICYKPDAINVNESYLEPPKTIYNYTTINESQFDDYYSPSKDNLNKYQDLPQYQIPTYTLTTPIIKPAISNLENQFRDYKFQLNQQVYTYQQMIDNIVLFFKEIIMSQREIEKIKQDIFDSGLTDVQQILFMIDQKKQSMIDKDDLKTFLKSKGIDITFKNSDIDIFFQRYGQRKQNVIMLGELEKMLKVEQQKQKKQGNEQLADQKDRQIMVLGRFFKMLINTESQFEYIRQKLKKKLCSFTYCYDYIDRTHQGCVTKEDLQYLLDINDFIINKNEAAQILKFFQPADDQFITLTEFIEYFKPKSNVNYLFEEDRNI